MSSEFAQTREPDNLFDDDFTPITEPVAVAQHVSPEHSQQPQHPQHHGGTSRPRGPSERGSYRGRARGARQTGSQGGHWPGGRRGSQQDRSGGQAPPGIKDKNDNSDRSTPAQDTRASASVPPPTTEGSTDPTASSSENPQASTSPAPATSPPTNNTPQKPPPAVRGNRLPTGGVQKPKLTDEELSERLAAAKLTSAKREAAHAAAAEDEAQFRAREEAAAARRKVEQVQRKALDQEREHNRARKLRGQGGREWDEGKRAEDFAPERGRGRGRRGMHGGVVGGYGRSGGYAGDAHFGGRQGGAAGDAEPPPMEPNEGTVLGEIEVGEDAFSKPAKEEREQMTREGRGGREGYGSRGYGRGRGRGGRGGRGGTHAAGVRGSRAPNLGTEDFPALQRTPKIAQRPISTPGLDGAGDSKAGVNSKVEGNAEKKTDTVLSPTENKTWAEQMEGVS